MFLLGTWSEERRFGTMVDEYLFITATGLAVLIAILAALALGVIPLV